MKKIHFTLVMCAVCILSNFKTIYAQNNRTPKNNQAPFTTTWNGNSWSNGKPTKLTKAIFAGDFKATENITALDVDVREGAKVTIEDNKSLTVIEHLKVAPTGKLTLIENAQLLQKNPQAPSAVVDVVRLTGYINKFDYTYFSSPVENQQLNLIGDPSQFTNYQNPNGPGGNTYLPPLFDKYYIFNSGAAPQGTDVNMFSSGAWQNIPENTVVNTPGLGFIVRGPNSFPDSAPTQQWQVKFTGQPYTGTQTRVISGTSYSPYIGPLTAMTNPPTYPYKPCENPLYALNLIGNPYTSMISADAFLTLPANITNLDGALYFWTHKNGPTTSNGGNGTAPINYTNNDYVVYNLVGGVGGSNRPVGTIATCQGFVVRGLSNNVATFTDNMTTTSGTDQMYRLNNTTLTTPVVKNRFWVSMTNTNNQQYRETLIGYMPPATTANDNILSSIPGSTNNFEKMYDVEIFKAVYNTYPNGSNDLSNRFELYSIINPTTPCPRLVIQGRKLDATFNSNDVVPLGFTCPAGTYTINGLLPEGIFTSQHFWLRETLNGVVTYYDIQNAPYTFTTTSATNDDTSRFAIVFSIPTPPSIVYPAICGGTLQNISNTVYSQQGPNNHEYQVATDPSFSPGSIVGLFNGNVQPFFYPYQFNLNIPGLINYNTTYYVRVATYQINGQLAFGPVCQISTPAPPTAQLTQSVNGIQGSCGMTVSSYSTSLYAGSPAELGFSTSGWRFQVSTTSTFDAGTIVGVVTSNSNSFNLAQLSGYTPQPNTTYYVRVQIKFNNSGTAQWQVDGLGNPVYGPVCPVYTPANPSPRNISNTNQSIFETTAYPNPFTGNFNIQFNSSSNENIEIKIYDLLGRLVESSISPYQEASNYEYGQNLNSGIYNIVITQGENLKTLRVIKR